MTDRRVWVSDADELPQVLGLGVDRYEVQLEHDARECLLEIEEASGEVYELLITIQDDPDWCPWGAPPVPLLARIDWLRVIAWFVLPAALGSLAGYGIAQVLFAWGWW